MARRAEVEIKFKLHDPHFDRTVWPLTRSRLGGPLRLRRGETLRTVERTSPARVPVFTGDGLASAR